MRTTIDIDDDVLQAAKERARREHRTAGQVVSELLRQALTAPQRPFAVHEAVPVYGVRPFAARGTMISNDLIDQLRNDEAN